MTKAWNIKDKYFQKAKAQGLRARSYFKLDEIDVRFNLITSNMHVLDLGAAPGSFMQYTKKKVGERGFLLGVDLTPIKDLSSGRVKTLVGEITSDETKMEVLALHSERFDLLLSDLAPKTSGIKDLDHWKSIELSEEVLYWSKYFLKVGGTCLIKIFQGSEFDQFLFRMKKKFQTVRIIKPNACRETSKEVYLLGEKKLATFHKDFTVQKEEILPENASM